MAGITFETRSPHVSFVAREPMDVRPTRRALLLARRITGRVADLPVTLPATSAWSWRGSLLVALVLLHPYLLVLGLPTTGAGRLDAAAGMCRLLATIGVLAAAVLLTYDWRISRRSSSGWLAMALGFQAAQALPFALLAVQGAPGGRFAYVVGLAQLPSSLVLATLIVVAARGTRLPIRNPLPAGLFAGALAGTARLVLIHSGVDPSLRLAPTLQAVVIGVVATVMGTAVVVLARSTLLPGWARARFAALVACVVVSRAMSTGDPGRERTALAVLFMVAGVVALGSAATVMLRQSIAANARQLANLAHRAATAEVSVRHGRERMHEVHATVAGIAQASRLLLQDGGPTGNQRRRLDALLDSEVARLERMLTRRGRQPVAPVALDEVLQPVVETQLTLGAPISFQPSGLRVLGRADDLAEVLHVLLSNAARHAPCAPVTVRAEVRDGCTQVRVSDRGPGIPAEQRPSMFTWGGRGAGSPGQGIGLQLARRLMQEQSGNLTLEDQGRPGGATFVLTIPSAPPGMP